MSKGLKRFWEELKRRKVLKVTAMYAGTAFIIMQVADLIFPRLGLPAWMITAIIVTLIIGLPLTIILSWFFDLTPEGKRFEEPGQDTREEDIGEKPVRRRVRFSDIVIAVQFVLILILAFPKIFKHSSILPGAVSDAVNYERSLVILPFDQLSDMTGFEYFADGISEDILDQLGNIKDLRVISRTTSRKYRGTDKTIPEIAEELDVNFVLEGSIRMNGDDVRFVAQLINARTDGHLFSRSYNRKINDIIRLQNDIALDVAQTLKAELLPETQKRMEARINIDPGAYESYLKGNFALSKYTRESNETAIEHYRKAIEQDPLFTDARAGLAGAYIGRFSRYGMDDSWVDSARKVIDNAIEQGMESSNLYAASALAYSKKGRPDLSIQFNLKALEFNPNNVMALSNLGAAYKTSGKLHEALKWYLEAERRDPLTYPVKVNIGVIFSYFGEPDRAESWFREAIKIQPDAKQVMNGLAHMYLAYKQDDKAMAIKDSMKHFIDESWMVLEWMAEIAKITGNSKETEELYLKAYEANPDIEHDWYAYSPIGLAYYMLERGSLEKGQKLLNVALDNRLKEIDNGVIDPWTFHEVAVIYTLMNRKEEAFLWLKKAVDVGWVDFRYALRDPWFDNIKNDPQFIKIMENISLSLGKMRQEYNDMIRPRNKEIANLSRKQLEFTTGG